VGSIPWHTDWLTFNCNVTWTSQRELDLHL
jgi:hypothetical protein